MITKKITLPMNEAEEMILRHNNTVKLYNKIRAKFHPVLGIVFEYTMGTYPLEVEKELINQYSEVYNDWLIHYLTDEKNEFNLNRVVKATSPMNKYDILYLQDINLFYDNEGCDFSIEKLNNEIENNIDVDVIFDDTDLINNPIEIECDFTSPFSLYDLLNKVVLFKNDDDCILCKNYYEFLELYLDKNDYLDEEWILFAHKNGEFVFLGNCTGDVLETIFKMIDNVVNCEEGDIPIHRQVLSTHPIFQHIPTEMDMDNDYLLTINKTNCHYEFVNKHLFELSEKAKIPHHLLNTLMLPFTYYSIVDKVFYDILSAKPLKLE